MSILYYSIPNGNNDRYVARVDWTADQSFVEWAKQYPERDYRVIPEPFLDLKVEFRNGICCKK